MNNWIVVAANDSKSVRCPQAFFSGRSVEWHACADHGSLSLPVQGSAVRKPRMDGRRRGRVTLPLSPGKVPLSIHPGKADFAASCGPAGWQAIFPAWIYYSADAVCMGAEFIRAYALRFGPMFATRLGLTEP
jgi:hypothetical protein